MLSFSHFTPRVIVCTDRMDALQICKSLQYQASKFNDDVLASYHNSYKLIYTISNKEILREFIYELEFKKPGIANPLSMNYCILRFSY